MVNHCFLHCPLALGLWHKLSSLAYMDWVPPRSIRDMVIISFRRLGNSLRGKDSLANHLLHYSLDCVVREKY